MSQVTWSTALLRILKAPETPANYRFLNAWATREHNGGPALSDGSNNPFFTTAGGSSTVGPIKSGTFPTWNSIGVAKYPNLGVGVYANAIHIQAGYPSILAALRSGNPAAYANNAGFQRDLTRWSGSGYSSVMNAGGTAAPVGPTVDTDKLAKQVFDATKGGGGVVGDIARHIPGVAQVEGAASATSDAAGAVAGFFGTITNPDNILRGLQIVAGGGLVAIGVVLLARQVALAADLPDPVKLAAAATGPVGRTAVAAGSVAANNATAERREQNRQAKTAPRATRGVKPNRPGFDAEPKRQSRADDFDYGDVPF